MFRSKFFLRSKLLINYFCPPPTQLKLAVNFQFQICMGQFWCCVSMQEKNKFVPRCILGRNCWVVFMKASTHVICKQMYKTDERGHCSHNTRLKFFNYCCTWQRALKGLQTTLLMSKWFDQPTTSAAPRWWHCFPNWKLNVPISTYQPLVKVSLPYLITSRTRKLHSIQFNLFFFLFKWHAKNIRPN